MKRSMQIFLAFMLVMQLAIPSAPSLPSVEPSTETSSTTTPAPLSALPPRPRGLGGTGPGGSPLDAPLYGQISLVKFTQVANGSMGGMAADSSGGLWVWGYNLFGELGVGGTIPPGNYYGGMKRIPYFVNNGIKVKEIGASYETRFALDTNGVVYAWGQGSSGSMGNGSTTATNYTPQPVPGLPTIEHIYPSDSYNGEASCMALATDGTLWAWGSNGSGQLGLNNTTNARNPQQVTLDPDFTNGTRHIVKISVGRSCSFLLDDLGDLWSTGSDTQGQQGNGSTSVSNRVFTIMDRSLTGMAQVADVDVSYAGGVVSDHVVAADVDGNAWEWGYAYPDNGAAASLVAKQTPVKIVVDPAAATAIGYQPLALKVTASERTGTFIDQHGRPWSWGTGYYFGLGREGGYSGTGGSNVQTINASAAQQMPSIVGDGDTQVSNNSAKIPVYKGGTLMPNTLRGYGFNTLHPTIYDEKYMKHDTNGNVLDTDGDTIKLVTTATTDGVGGLTPGLYYKTDSSGKVIAPGVVGTPALDPVDALWINLAFQPVPYIAQYDASLSAYSFLDANGNLFKWGNDGSGAIAWGWDYNPTYDGASYASNNSTNGLTDRYTYEVMYMRGAPTIDMASLSATPPQTKTYADPSTGQASGNQATVDVHVPATTTNDALDADVYSNVTSLQYVIVPYDESDSNFTQDVSTMTNDQFQALYDSTSSDLRGNLISSPITSGSSAQDLSYTVNMPVNGRLIVWETTDRYADGGGGSKDYQNINYAGTAVTADNVYTPASIKHQGVGTDQANVKTTLYSPTDDNVVKTNDDSSQTKTTLDTSLYGVALDANGQAIDNPTFGYDSVDIKSYEAVNNVGLPSGITPYWQFTQPQNKEVTKILNDASSIKDGYVQTFNYSHNPNYWTDVSGMKTWDDNDNAAGKRPASIELTLNQYARDPSTGAKGAFIRSVETTTVAADVSGNWKFDFGELKSYEYTYEVVETAIPGYQSTVTYPNLTTGPTTKEDLSGVSIVNTPVQHDLTKTVAAPTATDGKYHTGDTLTYTITASNNSDASDTWSN
ncbi:MAG: Cna B-type domain-containing protein, partial [Coriobacteriia bacterium]|nr:Cna B-type domain-containing protein [Coriobacteriia bacterium]